MEDEEEIDLQEDDALEDDVDLEDTDSPDDSEDTSDEGNDDSDSQKEEPDSETAKILARFKNDPQAIARAFAETQKFVGRQSNEVGELRKRLEALETSNTRVSEAENNSNSVDELGVEFIPDDEWFSDEYIEAVEQGLINSGMSEEKAAARAIIVVQRNREEWLNKYSQERAKRLQEREGADREWAASKAADMEKTVADCTATIKGRISKIVHPDRIDDAIKDLEERLKVIVDKDFRLHGIRHVYDENYLKRIYREVYSEMDFSGDFDKYSNNGKQVKQSPIKPTSTGRQSSGVNYTDKYNSLPDKEKRRIRQLAVATNTSVASVMKAEEEYDG